jgi:hypothetical protein
VEKSAGKAAKEANKTAKKANKGKKADADEPAEELDDLLKS